MNAFFGSTDMYLTGPESTFCPLFVFLWKKNSEHLEKALLSSKGSKNRRKFIKYHR
jgi:hypothetical protein